MLKTKFTHVKKNRTTDKLSIPALKNKTYEESLILLENFEWNLHLFINFARYCFFASPDEHTLDEVMNTLTK